MTLNKNISVESGLELVTFACQELGMDLPDLNEVQPHLRIAAMRADYSQAVWSGIWAIDAERSQPVAYDRLAILSFAHLHNLHPETRETAYWSDFEVILESKPLRGPTARSYYTRHTSETADGQAGIPWISEAADFREGFDAAMRRLRIARSDEAVAAVEHPQRAA